MTFQELIDKGIKHKEKSETNLALDVYRQALDIAETNEEKNKVWNLILHIHTDKMLATLIELAELNNTIVVDLKLLWTNPDGSWNAGINSFSREGRNKPFEEYAKPNKESLFK